MRRYSVDPMRGHEQVHEYVVVLNEDRFFCIGRVADGILTARFTYRRDVIRIIGAGYWRKDKRLYEKQNPVHR